jgi:hypothetical protein
MAEHSITIPPATGSISVNVGDTVIIHTAQACTFRCSIGGNFQPNLSNVELARGQSGIYTAATAGSGSYSTSAGNLATETAKSIQIHG